MPAKQPCAPAGRQPASPAFTTAQLASSASASARVKQLPTRSASSSSSRVSTRSGPGISSRGAVIADPPSARSSLTRPAASVSLPESRPVSSASASPSVFSPAASLLSHKTGDGGGLLLPDDGDEGSGEVDAGCGAVRQQDISAMLRDLSLPAAAVENVELLMRQAEQTELIAGSSSAGSGCSHSNTAPQQPHRCPERSCPPSRCPLPLPVHTPRLQ